jgi:hypothetical protein
VSSGEDEWGTSDADVWPGVAAADAEVAVAGFAAGCANRPLGCGSGDAEVEAEAEAEMWFAPGASRSAFSSSDNMVFATLVISFMSEISPIYKARGSTLKYKTEGVAHIIHETLATKDVGEEARGILDVRSALCADHLLPILVIHCPKVLLNRATAGNGTASTPTSDRGQEG